jgi:hypothetical protein
MSDRKVKPSQAKRIMARSIHLLMPTFVWGSPGIGKSEIVRQVAANLHKDENGNPDPLAVAIIDLRLALMEPTDLRGYPYRCEEVCPDTGNIITSMKWAQLSDLPTEEFAAKFKTVILFLDELNSAPPSVQAAAYQLVLDRRIGAYELPGNCAMICAGNHQGDKAITHRMPTPLANRLCHINMVHDFEDWFNWGLENKMHMDVLGYLMYDKESLNTFNPKDATNLITFATPRSWKYVSELLHYPDYNKVPLPEVTAEIAGRIGEGAAVKFLAHRKIAGKLPKAEDIMTGKVKELNDDVFAREMSAKYSLVVTLARELHIKHDEPDVNVKEFNKALNHVMRFIFNSIDAEMVVFFLKNVLKTNAEGDSLFNLRTALDADLKKTFHSRYLKFLKNVPDQIS